MYLSFDLFIKFFKIGKGILGFCGFCWLGYWMWLERVLECFCSEFVIVVLGGVVIFLVDGC